MAESGTKELEKKDNLNCKPCEFRDVYTCADGFCVECEENMCNSCFDTHKQIKAGRGHTLTNVVEPAEELEKCRQHPKEMIKFYCPLHEQVGCGDCMVFDHRTCKFEHIADRSSSVKHRKEIKEFVEEVDKLRLEANETLSSIKNKKAQITDINEKFTRDVNTFKEEMIAHVTKLTNDMLKQGEDMKNMDIGTLDQLKQESERMMGEIAIRTEELESQLDNMKNRNKIERYEFKRDDDLERSVKECKQLGNLQRIKNKKQKKRKTEK